MYWLLAPSYYYNKSLEFSVNVRQTKINCKLDTTRKLSEIYIDKNRLNFCTAFISEICWKGPDVFSLALKKKKNAL